MSIYSEINAFIKAEKAARRAAMGTKEQRLAAHLKHRAECDERSKLLAPIAEAERKRKSEEVHEALYREKQTAEDVKQHYHTINPDVVPAIGYTNNPKKKSQKKALRKLLKGSKRNLTLSHLFTPEALTELSAASGSWSWTSSNTAVATVAKTGTDTATSSTATATGVAAGTATITATISGTNDDGSLYSVSGSAQLTVTAAPAEKAHAKTATVSLQNSAATVGTAFSTTANIVNMVEPDDGSYTYAWSFSTASNGLTLTGNGASCTISGTPTSAMTMGVRCSIKDSYGSYATVTAANLVVSAAAQTNIPVESIATSWPNYPIPLNTYSDGTKYYCIADVEPTNATVASYDWSHTCTDGSDTGLTFTKDSSNPLIYRVTGTPTVASTTGNISCQLTTTDLNGTKVVSNSSTIKVK